MKRTVLTWGLAALVSLSLAPAPAVAAAGAPAAAPLPPTPPPVPGRPSTLATEFFYASGYQVVTSDGVQAEFDVLKPTLAAGDDFSLAQLVVRSADGQQVIQVGWGINPGLNGDAEPHLFIYHWVDGAATCYNGCGFVTTDASAGAPGVKLAPGTTRVLAIQHFNGNWWIRNGPVWMGYFPDSVWGGRYTSSGVIQITGQVASPVTAPCTDMGSGVFGTATAGARMSNIRLFNSTTAVNLSISNPRPLYYTAARGAVANELRYGGPGAC